jgi:energy-coupling factor transporter ATP-binding protein EcfA2
MIEAQNLTKRYGEKTAVDELTFKVRPGIVTGFLGPNGSGKSTTMRLIVGLDAPSQGTVTVGGNAYRDYSPPLHEVGVLLEARSVHTGRSAYHHLLALAQTHGIPRSRVLELISLVGLDEVARKRAGQFSAPAAAKRRAVRVSDHPGGADQRRQACRRRAHRSEAHLRLRGARAHGRRSRRQGTAGGRREAFEPPRPDRDARARRPVRRTADHPRAPQRLPGHSDVALCTGRVVTTLRVVIADDQPMMRAGFKAVLEATGDIEVVGEAGNGEAAVAPPPRTPPTWY